MTTMTTMLLLVAGVLAVCVSGAQALVAASAPGCAVDVDFFPEASSINIDYAVNFTTGYVNGNNSIPILETCNGTKVCNFPDVWQPASQKLSAASAPANPWKVVLPRATDATLTFKVSSPYLIDNANSTIFPCLDVPAVTRRLLASTNYTVTSPASMHYTVSIDGAAPAAGVTEHGVGGKLLVPSDDFEGEVCAEIVITLDGLCLTPSIDNFTIPTVTKQVCWYKPVAVEQAAATVAISTKNICDVAADNKTITVNISSITPPVMMGSGNTEEVDRALLSPVVHVYGKRAKMLDGTVITKDEYDEADAGQRINFVNHYIIPNLPLPADGLITVTLPANIAEGMYNISAKVFMMSDFPSLIGLTKTKINQADVAAVHNKTEVMGMDLFVDKEFGVQNTPTLLAEISSNKEGVAITTGDDITFTWSIVGAAESQTCTHGSDTIADCKSPMKVKAKDVGGATPVMFNVVITDVCGKEKELQYSYTAKGVTAVTKTDDSASIVGGGKVTPPKKNGAAATAAVGMLGLGMGLMAALL